MNAFFFLLGPQSFYNSYEFKQDTPDEYNMRDKTNLNSSSSSSPFGFSYSPRSEFSYNSEFDDFSNYDYYDSFDY